MAKFRKPFRKLQPVIVDKTPSFLPVMDVILEICDTFFFDYVYATLLPTSSADGIGNGSMSSLTFSNAREMSKAFAPASQYIQLAPSDFAFMSTLQRDNIWRQTLSLYLITWYASPHLIVKHHQVDP